MDRYLARAPPPPGLQSNCFTGAKVQILTLHTCQEKKEQDTNDDTLLPHLKKDQAQKNESTDLQTAAPESTNKGEKEMFSTLLALLVHKYKH